jgi:3D (Asp-Asp-Asp) domain-containing protein
MKIKNKIIPGTITLVMLTFIFFASPDVYESVPEPNCQHAQLLEIIDSLQQELVGFKDRETKFLKHITNERYVATAYLPVDSLEGRHSGLTVTGTVAQAYVAVAVDPEVIPINSWIWIDGLGWRKAEDTGNAIKGKKIDLCVSTKEEAMEFGVRKIRIKILK